MVGFAVKVTEVPGQILFSLGVMVTAGTGAGNTVIVTPVLVAVVGAAQVALDVMTTVTTSLLFKTDDVKVGLLVPALVPFTFHWYVPPVTFVEATSYVTCVPAQTVVVPEGLVAIVTVGVAGGVTVMFSVLLVTEVAVQHPAPVGTVITQVTASPLLGLYVRLELFEPVLMLFTFHWKVPPVTLVVAV